MKWYIKVLRHYADFSGRARRKEYWMAMLFNSIFALALMLLLMLVSQNKSGFAILAYQIYGIAFLLPSLAVFIRRLHDVGKSGWMFFILFIPIVGPIWLLVLLVEESQPGKNKYGQNPKTSPETFDEPAKLKSAGVTLIVSFALSMLMSIIYVMIYRLYQDFGYLSLRNFLLEKKFLLEKIFEMIWLITGILLLNGKQIYKIQGKVRNAILFLMVATGIYILYFLVDWPLWGMTSPFTSSFMMLFLQADMSLLSLLFNILIIVFVVTILFYQQNKNLIRCMSILVIVFAGFSLLRNIYWLSFFEGSRFVEVSIFSSILRPIALIVLASTFFPNRKIVSASNTLDIKELDVNATVNKSVESFANLGTRIETQSQSMAYWIGERMANPKKAPFVYYIFNSSPEARAALLELPFIHEEHPTGKLICDHIFHFGYYDTTENNIPTGKWDAFIAGYDLTHEMWEQIHFTFKKYNGTMKSDLEPDKNIKTASIQHGNSSKVVFVREDRTDLGTYLTYKGPSKADAMAFLSEQHITRSSYYVVVETPDGNYGKDIQGIYKE